MTPDQFSTHIEIRSPDALGPFVITIKGRVGSALVAYTTTCFCFVLGYFTGNGH